MDAPDSVINRMKGPGDIRDGVWRGGVIQIKWCSYCDLDCKNCSVGVGIAKKLKRQFYMTPEQLRTALQSLKGYTGVVGAFGGNPVLTPKFDEMCAVFREEFPDKQQRGLWSNRLFGHGKICRETFSPNHSNLNVHQVKEAYDEIRRDWPEASVLEAGLQVPSHHGPIFGAMTDLGIPAEQMWEKVAGCYVNQTWSAEITVVDGQLRGYFCEIAATMAELTGDPSLGVEIVPGWWDRPASAFRDQINHYCSRCLVAMNPKKVDAAGNEPEQYTAVWAPVMTTIKGRPLMAVVDAKTIQDGAPATQYLPPAVKGSGHRQRPQPRGVPVRSPAVPHRAAPVKHPVLGRHPPVKLPFQPPPPRY